MKSLFVLFLALSFLLVSDARLACRRTWRLQGDEVKGKDVIQENGKDAKPAKGKATGKSLEFKIYSRPYFVRNTFEPKEKQAFAVLKSIDDFNRVFGVGMVMRDRGRKSMRKRSSRTSLWPSSAAAPCANTTWNRSRPKARASKCGTSGRPTPLARPSSPCR